VAYREPAGSITNNLLIARAHAPVVKTFYDAVAEHLRQRRAISWLEIGSIPLTAAIAAHPGAARVLSAEGVMPISWTETAKFLEPVEPGRAAVDPRAFCYMLSNHSMPDALKSATRDELLSGPMLLGHLFRAALADDGTAPSYRYWRGSGGEWAVEYDRRKQRHPYYHIAEMMILDHVVHHAPCHVLEWGCGTGRHLLNLAQVPGVDVFGFDQSESMVTSGLTWATADWRASHVATGEPTGSLPYPDGHFDIVYTSEALLHTRPEDLVGRLAELVRVCRGHVVHIEAPPTWQGYSPWCGGCWGDDLVAAYRALGLECEVLTGACTRQSAYVVALRPESRRWMWSPAMLALYRRMEAQLEEGFARGGVAAHS
jgi:SAM-dependent methyltransferase